MPHVKDSLTIFLIIIFICHEIQECSCLRITEFIVPQSVTTGSQTILKCGFELDKDRLVNLKWYFNDKEFLRFEPGSEKETQIFQLPSLNIERNNVLNSADRGSIIRLLDTNRGMSGKYKCEVTIESRFFTTTREGHMEVRQPITTTSTPSYPLYHRPGKQLDLDSVEEENPQTSEVGSGSRKLLNWFNILNIMLIVYGLLFVMNSRL